MVWGGTGWNWLTTISLYLQPGQPLYVLLYASAIIFFCFFYTALVFNPRETADNLKKSGAFVPGIRPGEQTAKYIDKVMTRLTLVGAMYITFICLIPEFMRDANESTILLWWYLATDRGCRHHGLYGSSANSDDVKSVRVCIEESKSERL